ncbi:phosphotransferase enzyme family protein [Nocardiopsis alba]|uniref:phosphotransferase enzyme family protein n=1 Tax=Nocardiopsis alba TaxID=53437 RepID=UPI003D70638C
MNDDPTRRSREALNRLVAAAGLPSVTSVRPINGDGDGLDNHLVKAELTDGRAVVLRQSRVESASPESRIGFLRANGVTTPELYAADGEGASLWEFVPGRTLAEAVEADAATDTVWRRTGEALAEVHGVVFPAPLQGPIEVDALTLRPVDPVEELHASLHESAVWVEREHPHLLEALRRVEDFVAERAAEIRAERPTVTHGDINLLNIVVTDDEAVRLIDWDFPTVRYPLAELAAFDEHAYLHGLEGLPHAFFEGYGRAVPEDLLLAYRVVGCLGWLSSDDWREWDETPDLPGPARTRLRAWHERLLAWADRLPDLVKALG